MKKIALLSVISLVLCVCIGSVWAYSLLSVYDYIYDLSAEISLLWADELTVLFFLALTFIAVNVIYFCAERIIEKRGFSRLETVAGFVFIPLAASSVLAPAVMALRWIFLGSDHGGIAGIIINLAALAPTLSAIAYSMILPALLVRLVFKKIKERVIR